MERDHSTGMIDRPGAIAEARSNYAPQGIVQGVNGVRSGLPCRPWHPQPTPGNSPILGRSVTVLPGSLSTSTRFLRSLLPACSEPQD
jgi:hypothetical protein